jgi:NAD+ synthase (glutamine-hydrolysing)
MDYIKISICQINSTVGNLKNNIKKIIEFANNCKDSDFIVFPELCISGYPPEDLLFKEHFIRDCKNILISNIKNFPENSFTLIGHPDFNENNEVVNRLSIILNGKIISHYDKINLPNYSVFDEKRYFKEGNSIKSIWWDKVNFSFSICEDIIYKVNNGRRRKTRQ